MRPTRSFEDRRNWSIVIYDESKAVDSEAVSSATVVSEAVSLEAVALEAIDSTSVASVLKVERKHEVKPSAIFKYMFIKKIWLV